MNFKKFEPGKIYFPQHCSVRTGSMQKHIQNKRVVDYRILKKLHKYEYFITYCLNKISKLDLKYILVVSYD